MRPEPLAIFSSIAISLAGPCALADSVTLTNGDRLSGDIIFLDGSTLLLSTNYAGDITIRKDQIQTLECKQAVVVRQVGKPSVAVQRIRPGSPGTVQIIDGGASDQVGINGIERIMKPKPISTDTSWKGNIDLALDLQRAETDTNNINLDMHTTLVSGSWHHAAKAEYAREDDDEVTSTDNWNAEYTLDRFLTQNWFWEGGLNYKKDQVEDLRARRQVGTGPGYQFWDDQLGKLSVVGLLNRTQYWYADGGGDTFYSTSVRWDYNRFLIGKKFEFFASGELARPLNAIADYAFDSEIGMRYRLAEWASLNVKYEHEVVSGAPDGNNLDSARYTAGIGMNW
jgi:hypothetical protein